VVSGPPVVYGGSPVFQQAVSEETKLQKIYQKIKNEKHTHSRLC
jgi:hypothetical protein